MVQKKSSKRNKKSQKKQKKLQKEEKNELSEVSKEMYDIQVADLKNKLEKMKEFCTQVESEKAGVRESLMKINEDRADIILYLGKMLEIRNENITELQEQVTSLQQAREVENSNFRDQLQGKENEFKKTEERLTTEINLLNGKLNMLDEFRMQKEELNRKFELQEKKLKIKETQHQAAIHNVEKDFILKKIRMEKEVEERLIKLSEDFQTIMQSKIDSTTRDTITENNSLKTEMKKLMKTCENLIRQNDTLSNSVSDLKMKKTLVEDQLKHSIKKFVNHEKELKKLQQENENLKQNSEIDDGHYLRRINNLSLQLNDCSNNFEKQIAINKEINEKILCHQINENKLNENLQALSLKTKKFEEVIKNAAAIVKTVLNVHDSSVPEDNKLELESTTFASALFEILNLANFQD